MIVRWVIVYVQVVTGSCRFPLGGGGVIVQKANVLRPYDRNHDSGLTCSIGGRSGDDIRRRFRAFATHRAEWDELHQLVIASQNADAERVSGEHDDERHVEGHYRAVQNELSTHDATRYVEATQLIAQGSADRRR